MNKPKPSYASTGPGANTHNSGHSYSSISNNAPKPSDTLDRKSSTASSVGGGNPSRRPSSASSQRGYNSGGIKQNAVATNKIATGESPKPVSLTLAPPKFSTFASKSTTSNTSIKSNGNSLSVRPKSTGGLNNANININKPVESTQKPVESTQKSVESTQKPVENSQKPEESSQNQVENSQKPVESSQKPATAIVAPKPKIYPLPVPMSQSRFSNNLAKSLVSLEKSKNFRAFIEKAISDHKVFACCGVYPAIRNALKRRGWVEKPGLLAYSRSANGTLLSKPGEDESDVTWMTRVLKDYQPDFIWVIRRDNIEWKNMTKEQLINRFPKAWFTTKVGLAACLQHMHWFSEAGVSDTFFPRCYRLCLEEERQAFQDDFRLTACMSYLSYFVDTFEKKGHTALADVHSKITPLSVDFASRQLGNYIRMRRHEDIDWLLPPNFMIQHWDAFIHQYYAVVHEKKRLRFENPDAVSVKYEAAKKMLLKVTPYWPQIQLDGVFNMWICKPGARSRGKGIVIMNNLEKIMDLMTQTNFREYNWVVQKYIEKPLLIYKTKFDMRQWFLITDWTPLTVWFYKESYARFCTKPFILENFHESIHLCNNAIQCRYQNAEQRDVNLPQENMWSSDTFQTYLKTLGRLDAWPLIYSKMKQAIVGVLLASQESVENKKGCFELYGADFMLTEDLQPWLIEINSCPCMSASTSVTARMCSQCLEDSIKVVVDRRHNKNAETGMFEMIYRQNAGSVAVQQFCGHDLTIIGKRLTRDVDWPMSMSKSLANVASKNNKSQHGIPHHSLSSISHNNNSSQNQSSSIIVPSANKQTLSELLQKLRVRNQEMFHGALTSHQAKMDSVWMEAAKPSKTSAGTSGGSTASSELNVGTGRRHSKHSDASMFDIYRQSASYGGLQQSKQQDFTIIGKKLTGDVNLPVTAPKSAASNHPIRHPKEEPPTSQQSQSQAPSKTNTNNNNTNNNDTSSNPPVDSNKHTLSELLQKLRVRNQDVFHGAMGLS